MIAKRFRLKEEEVKKVLKIGKPFFSYGIVLDYKNNNVDNNRFAIIISGKNVDGSVERNFFRRWFYDKINEELLKGNSISEINTKGNIQKNADIKKQMNFDFVFVIKKQIKLDRKNEESIKSFDKDIRFLIKAIKDKVMKG